MKTLGDLLEEGLTVAVEGHVHHSFFLLLLLPPVALLLFLLLHSRPRVGE